MKTFLIFATILLLVLSALFYKSFSSSHVLTSNDGPLGTLVSNRLQPPGSFYSIWDDLNWIGQEAPTPGPSVTKTLWAAPAFFLEMLLGATYYFFFRIKCCRRDSLAKAIGLTCITLSCGLIICMVSRFTVLSWLPQLAGGTFLFSILTLGAINKI